MGFGDFTDTNSDDRTEAVNDCRRPVIDVNKVATGVRGNGGVWASCLLVFCSATAARLARYYVGCAFALVMRLLWAPAAAACSQGRKDFAASSPRRVGD
jgi:hypothetical protein